MPIFEIVGVAAILFGVFFSVMGVTGIVRLPDVYSRIHASGKITVLGVNALLLGAAFLMPAIAAKALTLALFLVLVAPAASFSVAQAAYRQGVRPEKVIRNDLAERDRARAQAQAQE
ncbi:MAG TPA: monovalent cation/H(+) antiporter subunit G [Aggregatilineales bacterium]|nr:monovalent cation/H(+) antiporter subunit G [Aggregatilineales bacterium]